MSNSPDVSKDHKLFQDRTCKECGEYKVHTEYSYNKNSKAPEGYVALPRCKPCHSIWKNKSHIERTYGLSWDEYTDLMDEQKGCCKLCGSEGSGEGKRLVVDHCHDTGNVRWLLCWPCNIGLGMFKDDLTLLDKVKTYLSE